MTDQARIDELLDQWEEAWEQGRPLSAAELCTEYPELTETVATQIRALKATSWLNETDGEEEDFLSLPPELTTGSFSVPASLSLEELTSHIVASGLLTTQQLQQVEASSADDLATTLIRNRQLTEYQVEQICAGNTGKLVLGNYVILDVIGAGGMGEVFKARHTRMKRVVALKILPEKAVGSPTAVERFHREVEAAARLTHPHIVVAHDADEFEGTHFLVMEFVAGTDLSSLVKQRGPLSFGQAVDCIIQAARGLEYAHGEGVVHRDIKPANLLLNNKGKVKILDMGLARFEAAEGADGFAATQAELTAEGTVLGTVDYLAPEQALDTHQADARADIYSLGCTLYYLLTGRPLYSGSTLMAKMLAHREQEIPAMSDHRADVPDELAAIFAKMVAKNPDDRYPSMSALLADLESLAAKYAAAWQPEPTAAAEAGAEKTLTDRPAHDTSSAGIADTLKFTPDPEPSDSSSRSTSTGRRWLLAIAAVAALLLGVILIQTPDGTIRIETNQTDVEVLVDGKQVVYITDPTDETKISVKIPKGAKTLRVTKAGFEADVKEFKLNTVKGAVRVRFVPVKGPSSLGGDVNREVAEWVIGLGGVVHVGGEIFAKVEQLPTNPFQISLLELSGTSVQDRDLERLAGLHSLISLHLSNTKIGDRGLGYLKTLEGVELHKLNLDSTKITDKGLSYFRGMRTLTSLQISNTVVSSVGIEHLKNMKTITALNIGGTEIDDTGFAHLAGLKKLENLTAYSTHITDSGIKHLEGLKSLTTIRIGGNKRITDSGIKTLVGFENLTVLDVAACNVTDGGLEYLKELEGLHTLSLDLTHITDTGLQRLHGMKKLEKLQLNGTKVTPQGIAKLQEALPNCKITWDGNTSPDREVAEWALNLGAFVAVAVDDEEFDIDKLKQLTKVEQLPQQDFRVTSLHFRKSVQPSVDDMKRIARLSSLRRLVGTLRVSGEGVAQLAGMKTLIDLDAVDENWLRHFHDCPLTRLGAFDISDKGYELLARHQSVEHLLLIGDEATDAGIAHLSQLPNLKFVQAEERNMTDEGLKHLAGLKSLHSLSMRYTQVTGTGFGKFRQTQISNLSMSDCPVTDEGLAAIGRISSVTSLSLDNTKVTNAGLKHLAQKSKLFRLRLEGTTVDDAGLQHIKGLTSLNELALANTQVSDKGLVHLIGLTKLRLLTLTHTKVTANGIAALQKALPNCKITWDGNSSPDREVAEWIISVGGKVYTDKGSFTHGERLPQDAFYIRHVDLNGNRQVKDDDLARLDGLRKLEVVGLDGTSVSDRALRHVKALTKLTTLQLGNTQVTNAGLEYLKELKQLTQLGLSYTQVGDDGLPHLSGLTNLTHLYLGATRVSDLGLEHLKGLTNLTHLYLGATQVSDKGLTQLKGLEKLTHLPLNETNISDAGLQHLKGWKKLTVLDFNRTQISDAGLKHLEDLTELSILRLSNTKVTAKRIADLRKALPNCKITWDGNSGPDRAIAKWVLKYGGTVSTDAGFLKDIEMLPHEHFRILSIALRGDLQLPDDSLKRLEGLTELVKLDLQRTNFGDDAMTHIKGLPRLRSLDFDFMRQLGDDGLKHLSGLTTLTSISLNETKVTDKGLQHLANIKTLIKVNAIKTKVTAKGVEALRKKLPMCLVTWNGNASPDRTAAEWVIRIGGSVSMADGNYTDIFKLPPGIWQIDVVSLHGKRNVVDNDLQYVSGLEKLNGLNLMYCQISDRGLEHLQNLQNLVQINLGFTQLKGPGLAHLEDLTKLQILNFHGTQIDDESLKHLQKLTELKHLELSGTRVTDAGLQKLTGLTKLDLLTLAETEVSDAGLQHLKPFANLLTLDLSKTAVTDEGLKQLTGLKKLTTIRLSKTKVTAAAIAELQKALPNCKMEWDGADKDKQ